jgi:NADPH:quinone reductase-like Zn-dependent oxidoreductase
MHSHEHTPATRSKRVSRVGTHDAHALWITAREHAELRRESLPALAAGEVLVRALYSGISRGSESLIYRHAVPESERARMRAPHQSGQLPGPVKYGYASVGQVLEGPAALCGRAVFCLYPHQSLYAVPESSVLPLPEGVPPARAVLAANMETALNALWDARPLLGQRIVVVGAGVVGALCGYLAGRIPGCEVWLVDRLPARAALAAALGVRFALPEAAPHGADLVLHASASAAGLALALTLAADEATVLELSWYGDTPVSLPLGAAFHAGRLTLQSSQVGRVGGAMRGRRSLRERLALALSLLDDPALDNLISGECTLAELPAQLPVLFGPESGALCQRVRYADNLRGA